MQLWALEIYTENRRGIEKSDSDGRQELDPQFNCFPPSPSRLLASNPFEFIHGRRVCLPRQVPERGSCGGDGSPNSSHENGPNHTGGLLGSRLH